MCEKRCHTSSGYCCTSNLQVKHAARHSRNTAFDTVFLQQSSQAFRWRAVGGRPTGEDDLLTFVNDNYGSQIFVNENGRKQWENTPMSRRGMSAQTDHRGHENSSDGMGPTILVRHGIKGAEDVALVRPAELDAQTNVPVGLCLHCRTSLLRFFSSLGTMVAFPPLTQWLLFGADYKQSFRTQPFRSIKAFQKSPFRPV